MSMVKLMLYHLVLLILIKESHQVRQHTLQEVHQMPIQHHILVGKKYSIEELHKY